MAQHIQIQWAPDSPIGTIYRFGYRVGHVKADEQGAGFLQLDYRNRKLDRPVESMSPALIHSLVENFCSCLDNLQGALTWRDVPKMMLGGPLKGVA